MTKEEALNSLEKLLKTPPSLTVKEYWEIMEKLSAKEQQSFSDESKKLLMSNEQYHRQFTI